MMNINVILTDEEQDLLALMMGAGTGVISEGYGMNRCLQLTNKLFALCPTYTPYDTTAKKPFKRMVPS